MGTRGGEGMRRIRLLLALVFALTNMHVQVAANTLDSARWQEMSEDYDFPPPQKEVRDTTKPKEKDSREPLDWSLPQWDLSPLQILLYVGIAILFIALVVYLGKTGVLGFGKKRVELRTTHDLENPDELVLTELEKELRDAALAGNYNRCLRYQYLLLLEKLQSLNLIKWHKYNTNGEYLNQLLAHYSYKDFRNLTIEYEYYWYGEYQLSMDKYEALVLHFEQLKSKLGHE